jgi:hypothetical protein
VSRAAMTEQKSCDGDEELGSLAAAKPITPAAD